MMNEELQQALADLIIKSTEVAGNALAFTQDQLPEVVQQLLLWKAAESAIWCFASVALFVFGACLPWRKWFKECEECEEVGVVLLFPFVLLFGIALAMFDLAWLQEIWLAPKVYLIEYAANLVK